MREMVFACGVEGLRRTHVEAPEELVLACWSEWPGGREPRSHGGGTAPAELHQREISGDGIPMVCS